MPRARRRDRSGPTPTRWPTSPAWPRARATPRRARPGRGRPTAAEGVPSRRALAVADFRHVRPGLIEVDVELGVLGRVGEHIEVGQRLADLGSAAAAVEPAAERLTG